MLHLLHEFTRTRNQNESLAKPIGERPSGAQCYQFSEGSVVKAEVRERTSDSDGQWVSVTVQRVGVGIETNALLGQRAHECVTPRAGGVSQHAFPVEEYGIEHVA